MQPSTRSIESGPDVVVVDNPEAVALLNAEIDRAQAHNRRVLSRLTPQGRRTFATYMRTGAVPPALARTAPRPRGAGRPAARRSAQRSSARSGDSGDDASSDPFDRDVDRLLRGLRVMAREHELERVYEPIPGSGHEPDRWKALCPVHPGVERYTLLITELPGGRADVCCSVGCSAASIRYILLGDRERERRAEAYAKVIVWAQQYGKRRAA